MGSQSRHYTQDRRRMCKEAPPVNAPAEFTGSLGITELIEGSALTADYQITDANGFEWCCECFLVLR